MAIGMTYDQYWYGDVRMVEAFREADRFRQRRENENAWLLGIYVKNAIDSSIGNAFREKGSQPIKYPAEPYGTKEFEEKQSKKRQQQREANEEAFALAYMTNMVRAGKNWGS